MTDSRPPVKDPLPWRERLIARIRHEAQPVEKFSHMPRLYALTQQIGAGTEYDDDVVFAASWVHDLGVFIGHRPEDPELLARWDSTAYTLRVAPALLTECGLPEEKSVAAIECIRTHEARYNPATLEGTILRDADLLEQLGTVAVMRTVCKIGRDTRFHTFADADASLRRALAMVPGQLRLPISRNIAETRIASLRTFLETLADESFSELS